MKSRWGIVKTSIGPITKNVEDAEKIMEVLADNNDYDKECPPLKW